MKKLFKGNLLLVLVDHLSMYKYIALSCYDNDISYS